MISIELLFQQKFTYIIEIGSDKTSNYVTYTILRDYPEKYLTDEIDISWFIMKNVKFRNIIGKMALPYDKFSNVMYFELSVELYLHCFGRIRNIIQTNHTFLYLSSNQHTNGFNVKKTSHTIRSSRMLNLSFCIKVAGFVWPVITIVWNWIWIYINCMKSGLIKWFSRQRLLVI